MGIAGTGGISSAAVGFGFGPPPNKLLTRDLLRWRTERAPSELRFGFVRRRKSVRKELSSEGMGSEMPIRVPVDLRNVFWATFSPGGRLCRWCLRMQTMRRSAATAPKTVPGKKPARTALVGKVGHLASAVSKLVLSDAAEY
jgi:hypothetical protein